ncbi:carboxypeptidase-like regulatory domain-containing protein [Lacinutrix salivirga]
MENQFNLEINTPCSEKFNQFTPTPKGGFCGSCEKEVIDFTGMNAQQIISYFKNKENKNTCGQFNSNQLGSYVKNPRKSKLVSLLSGIGLACLSLFSFTTVQAQEIKNSSEIKTDTTKNTFKVQGTILDENNLPLPGTNVVLQGSAIGTQTDFDGNFEFPQKLKIGDVLLFSFVGYESKKIVITNKDSASKISLKVNMDASSMIIMGRVAVKEVYKSKKQ